MKKKFRTILKWFIINRIIFLGIIFFLLEWQWFYINKRTQLSLFTNSSTSFLAILFILCPWEAIFNFLFFSLGNDLKPKIKVFWENIKKKFQVFLSPDFQTRLVKSTLALFIYVFFAQSIYYISVKEIKLFGFYMSYSWFYPAIPILGIFVFRMVYRWMFSPFLLPLDKSTTQKLNQYFLRRSNGLSVLIYILSAGVFLVIVMFFLSNNSRQINYDYSLDRKVQALLTIQNIETNPPRITGHLHVVENYGSYESGYYDENVYIEQIGTPPVLFEWNSLLIDGVEVPIIIDGNTATVDTDVVLKLEGSDANFPFNKFSEYLHIFPIMPKTYFNHPYDVDYEILRETMSLQIKIEDQNSPFRIYQTENTQEDIFLDGGKGSRYRFSIEYAPYYKLLVSIIICILFVFLWVIWNVNEKGQLVELSVGVFATIITLRGFLIPQSLTNVQLTLDQVLLIYITIFLLILLFKSSFDKIKTG